MRKFNNLILAGMVALSACGDDNITTEVVPPKPIVEEVTTPEPAYNTLDTGAFRDCETDSCQENQALVNMVVEQANEISYISHLSGLPTNWVASQIYVESKGNPCLRSSANAYGRLQLTKPAFIETMNSLAGKVNGSLYQTRVDRQRYPQRQEIFSQIDDNELDQILTNFSNETFSFSDYITETQERVTEYTRLDDEKPEGWIGNKRSLMRDQTRSNNELDTYLNDFWDAYIAFNGLPVRRGNNVLWHEIPLPQCSDNYGNMLDTLGALNLRREYSDSIDSFDAESDSVRRSTFNYNRDRSYYREILGNHSVLEEVTNN